MDKKLVSVLSVSVGMGLFSVTTQASQNYYDTNEFLIGGFVQHSGAVYQGEDSAWNIRPYINLTMNKWRFEGTELSYQWFGIDASDDRRIEISPILRYELDGYEESDTPILHGMKNREAALWAGVKAKFITEEFKLGSKLIYSLSDEFDAASMDVDLSRTWFFNRVSITPRIGGRFYSSGYYEYYYGVQSTEVTASRNSYTPSSGVELNIGTHVTFTLSPRQLFSTDLELTEYSSAVTNSPLTDVRTHIQFRLGYIYRF